MSTEEGGFGFLAACPAHSLCVFAHPCAHTPHQSPREAHMALRTPAREQTPREKVRKPMCYQYRSSKICLGFRAGTAQQTSATLPGRIWPHSRAWEPERVFAAAKRSLRGTRCPVKLSMIAVVTVPQGRAAAQAFPGHCGHCCLKPLKPSIPSILHRNEAGRPTGGLPAVPMVVGGGLEPSTRGFSVRCSTN